MEELLKNIGITETNGESSLNSYFGTENAG